MLTLEQRRKERQSDQMIDMAMAQEEIDIGCGGGACKFAAKEAKPRTGIEHQKVFAATNFNT